MANTDEDNLGLGKELADAFAADEAEASSTESETPVEQPKPSEPTPPAAPKGEEPNKDEPVKPEDPQEEKPVTPPADPKKEAKDDPETPKDPEAPVAPEEPVAAKPLTKDDLEEVVAKVRTDERVSSQNLETATKEVLDAYYPEGLSNVLVDQATGKELKTPQDVVQVAKAQGNEMSIEEAAQWLLNEQHKIDGDIDKIKNDARVIAETTIKFKQDSIDVLQRYEPIFKAYPQIQEKIWNQFKKLIKIDEAKDVVLSAPDMREFYDTVLEPYRLAYEFAQKKPGTNPTPPAEDAPVAPVTPPAPGAEDRLDEGGDGVSEVDDPNDFAQQLKKELAKDI